ncbi:MAG: tail fiber domain-containing protein [Bacteroidaceae bacterium]|nr:tail fiber domain-containing protein [Bacteroidaceae bacterium]
MKKIIITLVLMLFVIGGKAQFGIDKYGDTFIGNLLPTDSASLRTTGLFIKGYPGLFMQHNVTDTENMRAYFQVDVNHVNPCFSGYLGKVVFYNTNEEVHNAIIVKRLLSSSGVVISGLSKKLSNSLETIAAMEPVSYYWKNAGDTASSIKAENRFQKVKNYGFIAQQVEKVIPALVTTDKELGKAVNYEGVIPLLAGAVQILEGKLMEQKGQLSVMSSSTRTMLKTGKALKEGNNTEIGYNIPEEAKNAFLILTTMDHEIVLTDEITARGSGSFELKTANLDAGIYRYAIMVDGNIEETENIAITKQ